MIGEILSCVRVTFVHLSLSDCFSVSVLLSLSYSVALRLWVRRDGFSRATDSR